MAWYYPVYVKKAYRDIFKQFLEIVKKQGESPSEVILKMVTEYVQLCVKEGNNSRLDEWAEKPEARALPSLGVGPDWRLLIKLPADTLAVIAENAEAYASLAKTMLKHHSIHADHKKYGMKDPNCYYCRAQE